MFVSLQFKLELKKEDKEKLVKLMRMQSAAIRVAYNMLRELKKNLYRWENFRESEDERHEWIERINNARNELDLILMRQPSVKAKAKENIQTAWELAVQSLIDWFEEPKNHQKAKSGFGRLPTQEDFPKECPYSFEEILDYEPWVQLFQS